MNIAALKAELIAGHPVTGAYNADDALAADEMNAVNRTRGRTSMTGSEVINAVDAGDWNGLTDAKKQTVWDVVHLGDINPFGVEEALLIGAFGGNSTTIANLATARVESISQATKLGLGNVREGTVAQARAI